MNANSRTYQKLAMSLTAVSACLLAFHACNPAQASAIATLISALAALWEPRKS